MEGNPKDATSDSLFNIPNLAADETPDLNYDKRDCKAGSNRIAGLSAEHAYIWCSMGGDDGCSADIGCGRYCLLV